MRACRLNNNQNYRCDDDACQEFWAATNNAEQATANEQEERGCYIQESPPAVSASYRSPNEGAVVAA
jgi:hypothetical protein